MTPPQTTPEPPKNPLKKFGTPPQKKSGSPPNPHLRPHKIRDRPPKFGIAPQIRNFPPKTLPGTPPPNPSGNCPKSSLGPPSKFGDPPESSRPPQTPQDLPDPLKSSLGPPKIRDLFRDPPNLAPRPRSEPSPPSGVPPVPARAAGPFWGSCPEPPGPPRSSRSSGRSRPAAIAGVRPVTSHRCAARPRPQTPPRARRGGHAHSERARIRQRACAWGRGRSDAAE